MTSAPDTDTMPQAAGSGVVAGYRLLRRVATGDRAEVHLAVEAMEPADHDAARHVARRALAVRIYRPGSDDDRIGTEIAAMSADASGTLPALVDVAVLEDGRRILVVERIGGPTLARVLGERVLDPGEATTILAPLVAAAAGLADVGFVHGRLATSDVMIDETGRPRLIGLGAVRALDAAGGAVARTELMRDGHRRLAGLIEEVARSTRRPAAFERAVAVARAGADSRPFERTEGEIERALFAAAPAVPLRTGVNQPGREALPTRFEPSTGVITATGHDADVAHVGTIVPASTSTSRPRGWRKVLGELAQLPPVVVDRVADAADAEPAGALRRRARAFVAGRRRTLVVGAATGGAALVLLLTLVPPSAEAGRSAGTQDAAAVEVPASGSAESSSSSASSSPVGTTAGAPSGGAARLGDGSGDEPSDVPSAGPGATGSSAGAADMEAGAGIGAAADPVAAAIELMSVRTECLAKLDAGCLDGVDQPGSAIERADRAMLAAAREGDDPVVADHALDAMSVSAEMGEAVLLRLPYLDPQREPASLLVMRGEAGWRLRELFD